jgi:hypothetical protein
MDLAENRTFLLGLDIFGKGKMALEGTMLMATHCNGYPL